MIFQSLAPQASFKSTLRQVGVKGTPKDSDALKEYLLEHYQGSSVELYGKGRTALAEAVRVATGGEGRVLISSLTCYSVEQAVIAAGCRPVYVDITDKDLQFSKKSLEAAFEDYKDIKAIIVQNTLGIPPDIKMLKSFAKENNITLIEDLAHSAGSKYLDGTEVGTVGDITMLSFGRDKAVDTTNGGAVILRKPFNHRLRKPHNLPSLKDQVRDRIYPLFAKTTRVLYPIILGRLLMASFYKMRWAVKSADGEVEVDVMMSHWQAKLALERLKRLPNTIKHRQQIAKKIFEEIDLKPIASSTYEEASILRVPFLVKNRYEVLKALKSAGIFFEGVWYDSPVSPRRYLNSSNFVRSQAPNAVKISSEIINIPTSSNILPRDIETIALIVNRVAEDAKN